MKDKINWFITLVVIVLLFLLITLLLNNLVDSKISNIEVRIPNTQYGGVDSLTNMYGPPLADIVPPPPASPPIMPVTTPPTQAVIPTIPAVAPTTPAVTPPPLITPPPVVTPSTGKTVQSIDTPVITNVCETDADCNKQTGQIGNICKADKTCYCVTGSGKGCEVVTFYKNPKEMTEEQRQKFKTQADFAKMTIGDYMNWLELYRNDIANLSKLFPTHLKNYEKFLLGQLITIQDLELVRNMKNQLSGLDTAQNLFNRYLGDGRTGEYPEVFAYYPSNGVGLEVPSIPIPSQLI